MGDNADLIRRNVVRYATPMQAPLFIEEHGDTEAFRREVWDSIVDLLTKHGPAGPAAHLATLRDSRERLDAPAADRWRTCAYELANTWARCLRMVEEEGAGTTLDATWKRVTEARKKDGEYVDGHLILEMYKDPIIMQAIPEDESMPAATRIHQTYELGPQGDVHQGDVPFLTLPAKPSTTWGELASHAKKRLDKVTRAYQDDEDNPPPGIADLTDQTLELIDYRIAVLENVLRLSSIEGGLPPRWGDMTGNEKAEAIAGGGLSTEQRLRNAEFRAMIKDPDLRRTYIEQLIREVGGTQEEQWEELGRRCLAHGMESNIYKTPVTFGNAIRAWARK